jgi:hypothetical protein
MKWLLVGALVSACAASSASGPQAQPPGGPLTTVDGEVIGVDRRPPGEHLQQSVRVTLRVADQAPVVVELAPGWVLDEEGLTFNKSDRLIVQGTRQGNGPVVARRVTVGEHSVDLRTEEGAPTWKAQPPPKEP